VGFLDKAQAKVSEVTKAAQEGIADQQSKRKADGLFQELGKWTYAKHKGGFDDVDQHIARLLGELATHEAEHGEFGKKEEPAAPPPPPPPSSTAAPPLPPPPVTAVTDPVPPVPPPPPVPPAPEPPAPAPPPGDPVPPPPPPS
jgi:hypothetical protein